MKKILTMLICSTLFISCKREKCYQCSFMQTYLPTSGTTYPVRWQTQFCGTEKEKDNYVKENNTSYKSGNRTYYIQASCK